MSRYKFYREHKYVSHVLHAFESNVAKADMSSSGQRKLIADELERVIALLTAHAEYEERCLHPLLKEKGSSVLASVEDEHLHLDEDCSRLKDAFTCIEKAKNDAERWESGYSFYLKVRKFYAEMLLHLHEEETILLPELQRLYSDDELRVVEAKTYAQMSAADLKEMLAILFPHMNREDYTAFLFDIKHAEPEKFNQVWQDLGDIVSDEDKVWLEAML